MKPKGFLANFWMEEDRLVSLREVSKFFEVFEFFNVTLFAGTRVVWTPYDGLNDRLDLDDEYSASVYKLRNNANELFPLFIIGE